MAGDHMKRIRPGDPVEPSARVANATRNALRAAAMAQHDNSPPDRTPASGFGPHEVKVKNASGTDRKRFELLGLEGISFSKDDNENNFYNAPIFLGKTPAVPKHCNAWVILSEPIKDGKVGRGIVYGSAAVLLQVDAGFESMPFASIKDGEATKLYSSAAGLARILWREKQAEEDQTGLQWARVLMGPMAYAFGNAKLSEDLKQGNLANGKMQVVSSTTGNPSDATDTVKICCPILKPSYKIPETTIVAICGEVTSRLFEVVNGNACSVPYTP